MRLVKKYSKQFKKEALEHLKQHGRKATLEKFNLPEPTLYGWKIREAKKQVKPTTQPDIWWKQEIANLRAENNKLKDYILKSILD